MLSTYEKSMTSFRNMKYEDKKKKVVAMLDVLKEDGNVFEDLWNLVHINSTVSEWVLDMIYQLITKAMYTLKEEEMEASIEKLENLKVKISDMREQENYEKWDADSILEWIR